MISVQQVVKTFNQPKDKSKKQNPLGVISKALGTAKGKRFVALDAVSFSVSPGEIFGLLGPNGAGKTTMLRIIATLLKADSGFVEVMGHDVVKSDRKVRSLIGFLTSDMKLTGTLSPREILEFFGKLNHLDQALIKKRIQELAEYLEMSDFLDRPVEKLSTGQKQKTSLAVSLIHDPPVILFDEPTNGLDIIAARTVVNFLRDAKTKGKTVILSTHIMSEAEKLCDRVGIILQGQLCAEGTVEGLCTATKQPDLESVFFHFVDQRGGLGDAN